MTLAIIKQSDENMDVMKEKLKETTDYFASLYPDIEFSVSRNQTELLDYTISNLQQNLSLGFLFIFIVAVLFLGDVRSPLIIGISMVTSIVITFFFFYFCHVSLNVISLSGLILAVGMMIDSAIIVTENISQYRERGVFSETFVCRGHDGNDYTDAQFVPYNHCGICAFDIYEWHSRSYFYGSGFFYHGGIDDILYYGYYVAARIVSVVFIRSVSAVRDFFPDVLTIC